MSTVWDHYRRVATRHTGRPAVVDQQGTALTHGRLLAAAEGAAGELAGLGARPGAVVGAFLPNRASWPVLALGAARAGVGLLGLNTRFRHAELNHLLPLADVELVVTVERFLGVDPLALLAELDRPPQLAVGDGRPVTGRWPETATATDPPAGRSESPMIGFTTSGTTGRPKIAMHDQGQALRHLRAVAEVFELDERSVTLAALPLCGAFGYTTAMATVLAGGCVVAHETWDPGAAARAMTEAGVTFCCASDDMLLDLVAHPDFDGSTTTWRRGGFADFTNAGPACLRTVEEATGGRTRLTGLYGSSEGFALMSSWPWGWPRERRWRNGGLLLTADMEVRCCDPNTGQALEPGQPGELQFRGPNLIRRYLNDPAATARAMTDDGWYRSGDLGHLVTDGEHEGRQGFVYLARLGDSLRLRGFLCDPAEIEHHLERHPGVDLAQVVGVARPGEGDVAVAFVRRTDPAITAAELLDHCRSALANYKRPAHIEFVTEFPVTDGPNGVKIRKVELRARAERLLAPR